MFINKLPSQIATNACLYFNKCANSISINKNSFPFFTLTIIITPIITIINIIVTTQFSRVLFVLINKIIINILHFHISISFISFSIIICFCCNLCRISIFIYITFRFVVESESWIFNYLNSILTETTSFFILTRH